MAVFSSYSSEHTLALILNLQTKVVLYNYERFEPRSHFISILSMIVRVNVVLNRTVVVDSD